MILVNRTLSDMRGECVTASQQLHVACMNLEAKVTQKSSSNGVETSALEKQLREKLKEVMQLQGRWDAEKVELNSRSFPNLSIDLGLAIIRRVHPVLWKWQPKGNDKMLTAFYITISIYVMIW